MKMKMKIKNDDKLINSSFVSMNILSNTERNEVQSYVLRNDVKQCVVMKLIT